jgi:hypothetical protein
MGCHIYIPLRSRWGNVIFLNVQALSEKRQIYEELEQVFRHFPNHHLKNVRDFNEKLGGDDIFKLTIGNMNQKNDDNGARIVNFAT